MVAGSIDPRIAWMISRTNANFSWAVRRLISSPIASLIVVCFGESNT